MPFAISTSAQLIRVSSRVLTTWECADDRRRRTAAFPQRGATLQMKDNVYFLDKGGMSLRDYFAAAAMQALLHPSHTTAAMRDFGGNTHEFIRNVAVSAYRHADAMLRERSGTGQMNITTTSSEHREENK
jgi:hypothetical protein